MIQSAGHYIECSFRNMNVHLTIHVKEGKRFLLCYLIPDFFFYE